MIDFTGDIEEQIRQVKELAQEVTELLKSGNLYTVGEARRFFDEHPELLLEEMEYDLAEDETVAGDNTKIECVILEVYEKEGYDVTLDYVYFDPQDGSLDFELYDENNCETIYSTTIDTFEEEKTRVCDILKNEMEAAAELKVDLIADLHTGNDWYEAK